MRIAETEKDVPMYVVIRKWIQNDPDSEMMPLPAHGDDLAEAKRSLAPKLPPVPPPSEEERKLEMQPNQAPMGGHGDEPASVEVCWSKYPLDVLTSAAMQLSFMAALKDMIAELRDCTHKSMQRAVMAHLTASCPGGSQFVHQETHQARAGDHKTMHALACKAQSNMTIFCHASAR